MKIRLRYQVLVFTFTRITFNTLFRMVYPFMPVIARGLNVDFAQLSRAVGWRGLMGFFGPLYAWLADSKGRKTGMLFGTGMFVLGLGVVIVWPTFWGFTAMLIVTTFGKFAFDPAMQAYLGDRVPYQRRGFVLGLTELGWSGAFFIGVPAFSYLIDRAGWFSPFPVLAGLGIAAFIVLAVILPPDNQDTAPRQNLMKNMRLVLSSRNAWAGMGVTLFASASNEMVNLVFGQWLEDDFGVQIVALGLAAAVIGFSELSGELLVSGFIDRLGKRRALGLGLFGSILAVGFLPVVGVSQTGALVGLFLFYLAFEIAFVSAIVLMTELLPEARATLMAAIIACASLGRAAAAWVAPGVYLTGFTASVAVSGAVNLLALLALSQIKLGGENG